MDKDAISLITMIIISIVLAYFFTMTLILRKNSTHQRNKLFQSLLMGAWMGLIMIGLMMYTEGMIMKKYIPIIIVLIVVIAVLTYSIRQQKSINQDQFMLGMIEHHQMAIEMAKLVKPKVSEPKLNTLVNNIISSQTQEISDMYDILDKRGVRNELLSNFI